MYLLSYPHLAHEGSEKPCDLLQSYSLQVVGLGFEHGKATPSHHTILHGNSKGDQGILRHASWPCIDDLDFLPGL